MARTRMPEFTNQIRVRLDFILEFDKLHIIPSALAYNINDFISGGVMRVIPKKDIKEKYGDISIKSNAHINLTHLTVAEARRYEAVAKQLEQDYGKHEASSETIIAQHKQQEVVAASDAFGGGSARARKVPRVRKALQRRK